MVSIYWVTNLKKVLLEVAGTVISCWRFEKFNIGLFVTAVQLIAAMSLLCCNTKFVEGRSHDNPMAEFFGWMFN